MVFVSSHEVAILFHEHCKGLGAAIFAKALEATQALVAFAGQVSVPEAPDAGPEAARRLCGATAGADGGAKRGGRLGLSFELGAIQATQHVQPAEKGPGAARIMP